MTSSDDSKVFLIIIGILSIPFLIALYGWTISILWGWFIVPLFQLPQLSVWTACGVALTGRVILETGNGMQGSKEEGGILEEMIKGVLKPLIMLLFGAIYQALAF